MGSGNVRVVFLKNPLLDVQSGGQLGCCIVCIGQVLHLMLKSFKISKKKTCKKAAVGGKKMRHRLTHALHRARA